LPIEDRHQTSSDSARDHPLAPAYVLALVVEAAVILLLWMFARVYS
jgi:hypothetical protein